MAELTVRQDESPHPKFADMSTKIKQMLDVSGAIGAVAD
jgi:hypothetical protein